MFFGDFKLGVFHTLFGIIAKFATLSMLFISHFLCVVSSHLATALSSLLFINCQNFNKEGNPNIRSSAAAVRKGDSIESVRLLYMGYINGEAGGTVG